MTKDQNGNGKMLAELRACEIEVWEALAKGDVQADEAALADGFLGVYPDGFAEKSDHVKQLSQGPTVKSYDLSDFRVMSLGPTHAVLAYRAHFLRTDRTVPEVMYVSSIWRRTGESWISVFSQDTPASN